MRHIRMMGIVLLFAAYGVYIIAPSLGLSLFGVGLVIEIVGWVCADEGNKRGKDV